MEIVKKELVSVIIPTYSRPVYLKRAINSVLNQTYKNIEVVVVDDNNPETKHRKETENVMLEFLENSKVKYLRHSKNRNGSAARNTGIEGSNGYYIALLDDDDEFLPLKIEKQIEALNKLDNSYGGVYCNYQQLLKDQIIGKYKNVETGNIVESLLLCNNSICGGSTLLLKRSVLVDLKGFDISFLRHQDWELLVRYFRKYKLGHATDVLVNIHMDSRINTVMSRNAILAKEKFLTTFKNDIEEFNNGNEIYKRQWFTLGISLLEAKNKKYAIQCFKRAYNYQKLSVKDYLLIFLNWLNKYIPIKKIIKKVLK
jgi:glycosyltransferase involved in cell wall biosynthesis